MKETDSKLIPPAKLQLHDGKKNDGDFWFNIYFLNKEKNEIFFTWVRSEAKEKTDFALVSVSDGLKLSNWKEINKSFTGKKNEIEKKNLKNLFWIK